MVQIDLLNSELPQIFNLLKKNAVSAKHSKVKCNKKGMPVVNYSSMICWIICALLTYQKHLHNSCTAFEGSISILIQWYNFQFLHYSNIIFIVTIFIACTVLSL